MRFFFAARRATSGWLAIVVLGSWGSIGLSRAEEPPRSDYVEPRSTGTRRETEPPRYVRTLNQSGTVPVASIDWLDVGFEHRTRYEYRDDDLRRPAGSGLDEPYLLRNRLYLGIKNVLDPFRGVIELQDSRRYNSEFVRDDRDVNAAEPIQAYGELFFENGLGEDRPLRLRAGRMAFELLDRRLVARNEWRNTTNTFQGLRLTLGKESDEWQVDLLGLHPLERRLYDVDRAITSRWFVGAIGNWRRWSQIVTLQPYWLVLLEDTSRGAKRREIQAPSLRFYGVIPQTTLDFDVDGVYQFGDSADKTHKAYGFTTEIGYTFPHAWKPRLSAFYGQATGDEDPQDGTNERFERFFGFARPWSSNDYIAWENIRAPKVRIEVRPHERLRIDTGYNWYWLDSRRDTWATTQLRDETGQRGRELGSEWDMRAILTLADQVQLNVGGAHFHTGHFPRARGKRPDSQFFYVELSLWAFT